MIKLNRRHPLHSNNILNEKQGHGFGEQWPTAIQRKITENENAVCSHKILMGKRSKNSDKDNKMSLNGGLDWGQKIMGG